MDSALAKLVYILVGLAVFLSAKSWNPRRDGWFVFAFCIFIGLLLFPTTALSDRTPELESFPALVYWLIGHALYGVSLALLLKKFQQKG